jgi:Rieske Fe-S protein
MSEHDDTRRAFLHTGGCFALALVAAGVLPRDLLAQPIGIVTGTTSGQERTYPVPAADGVSIDRVEQVILVRSQNRAFAFALSCPHQNAAVRWVENDHRFQCTKHDSKYQPDGTYTSGRATRNMDRFPIRRDGASLVVSLDRVFHSDVDTAGWAASAATL